jgi:hypothetical protein
MRKLIKKKIVTFNIKPSFIQVIIFFIFREEIKSKFEAREPTAKPRFLELAFEKNH